MRIRRSSIFHSKFRHLARNARDPFFFFPTICQIRCQMWNDRDRICDEAVYEKSSGRLRRRKGRNTLAKRCSRKFESSRSIDRRPRNETGEQGGYIKGKYGWLPGFVWRPLPSPVITPVICATCTPEVSHGEPFGHDYAKQSKKSVTGKLNISCLDRASTPTFS